MNKYLEKLRNKIQIEDTPIGQDISKYSFWKKAFLTFSTYQEFDNKVTKDKANEIIKDILLSSLKDDPFIIYEKINTLKSIFDLIEDFKYLDNNPDVVDACNYFIKKINNQILYLEGKIKD